jgi:adenosyl cobinamide kinase/adenosyl cobinamide phosphate guanylyltransferase
MCRHLEDGLGKMRHDIAFVWRWILAGNSTGLGQTAKIALAGAERDALGFIRQQVAKQVGCADEVPAVN